MSQKKFGASRAKTELDRYFPITTRPSKSGGQAA